jgi:transposase
VGTDAHWVAVPKERDAQPVPCCGTLTAALDAVAAWLRQCQMETVVLESTGVSGRALFAVLAER